MRIGRAAGLRQKIVIVVAAMLPALAGCSNFFVPENTSGGGTGGGGTTGNSVYIANSLKSSLDGLSVVPAVAAVAATATTPAVPATPAGLTAITGLPTALGFVPLAMAVTPKNTFLYVSGVNGIRVYAINSNGTLTASTVNRYRPAFLRSRWRFRRMGSG